MNPTLQGAAIISLIKSCSHKSHLLQIHSHLLRSSLFFHPSIFLSFLSRLALPPLHLLSYSSALFSSFPTPTLPLFNTLIRAHSFSPVSAPTGFHLFRHSLRSAIPSNAFTLTFVLKCCIKSNPNNSPATGMQIHTSIWKLGFLSDAQLMTTLMDFYSCSTKPGDACKVFEEMPHRDVVAWNVLISCFTRNGRTRDALALFDRIRSTNECQPDDVTCLLILQVCGSLNCLEFGESVVHRYIIEHGLDRARNVCNSLIAMYSRCGSIEKAFEVFDRMVSRDVVSWSAMISGLASNGYGHDAVEAFRKMQQERIPPDDQTFTGVLSACSHSGLVNEGRAFFYSMTRDFGVTPNIHHYGCMVDLLGRAGFLQEAYDLIRSMRIKPDVTIWRTLLSACRIHRDVALGEHVVNQLVELKAQEAGDYILLLNIYSSIGNSEKVLEVRKTMKEEGIETTPAVSTIEVNGRLHEFFADDTVHPRKKEVYRMLDEINQQLRIGGYVAEMTSEVCDLDASSCSHYHSEKLAMAFGVMSMPPGTTIRVAKDLRICLDCHNFAKSLSAVYSRKVVIRDRNRFHHFRDGKCSCNDYW